MGYYTMDWKIPNDKTDAVITAQKHIASSHGNCSVSQLPETCIIFEMGMAIPFIEEQFSTYTITENIPGFITDSKCIGVTDNRQVCFIRGGYGAPAAVDTLETVLALGVKRIIVMGMCGGFSANIHIGDVVVPHRVFCEEGTSQHYLGNIENVMVNEVLQKELTNHFSQNFNVLECPTISTDAVYRQTMAKEAAWRSKGCVVVDMESSALLSVCQYYSIPAAVVLICSDLHPMPNEKKNWNWGNINFKEKRKSFVQQGVLYVYEHF